MTLNIRWYKDARQQHKKTKHLQVNICTGVQAHAHFHGTAQAEDRRGDQLDPGGDGDWGCLFHQEEGCQDG